ncbi:SMODS domain-containing nucleotidyltransferase [Psychromonas sp. PT13]|uniref:SMODS domain-containing nucleotidyltransferase n=1 Tax=Psychromonas sp. PT13 TaxID=3439547 RepID=UPI003EBA7C2B
MKHQKIFTQFLNDTVNLNQTRLNKMESISTTVINVLKDSDPFKDLFIASSPQGSYGHRTIIKPLPSKEFDADIVVFVSENEAWSASDYVKEVYKVFKNNVTYTDMVHYNTRCVYLDYAGDFHIDIVPCMVKKSNVMLDKDEYFVCNRATNEFEPTDPEAYKAWLKAKNTTVKNNNLIKSIRLFKYLRDIKQKFSCKSVLLTTLLGNQVINNFDNTSDHFTDIATSFRSLITRLDQYLQANPAMPEIVNPVQPGETFTRHWDEVKYKNFRSCIHRYKTWVDEAYEEQERAESIDKWRRIFGDNFHSEIIKSESRASTENYDFILKEGSLPRISIPTHCINHPWNEPASVQEINVKAHYKKQSASQFINRFILGSTVPKMYNLKFEITNPIPSDMDIYWQITNTGVEAKQNNQLRGGFEKGYAIKEESTSYKGVHFVEAFVVQHETLVARSGKVIVSIGP